MDIVTYSDKPILLMSSNKFLEDIDFTKSVLTAEPSANFNLNSNDIFSGHPLEITYYEFAKKLYSTYLSYLPKDKFAYDLNMHIDNRGSFTEFLRTNGQGQVSVNIAKPGIVKGNHWHHTKNEKFLVRIIL